MVSVAEFATPSSFLSMAIKSAGVKATKKRKTRKARKRAGAREGSEDSQEGRSSR